MGNLFKSYTVKQREEETIKKGKENRKQKKRIKKKMRRTEDKSRQKGIN